MEDQITFGTSGLDRAAHLRGDAVKIAALGGDVLPMWRGKALMRGDALVFLPKDHKIFRDAAENAIFLGLSETGEGYFARDISRWEPSEMDPMIGAFQDGSVQHHPDLPGDAGFAELRMSMTRLTRREAELGATARAQLEWHRSHAFCANCGSPSVIAQSGWQRDCPACGRHHFPRTDPVVIMLITHGNSVLLGRSPGWPDGFYSLLAGFIEPGETVEAAVRREVFEEAGVRVGPVRYAASQPWPYPGSLMLGCTGLALDTKITVDANELADARWVTREDMVEVFAGRHPELSEPRRGAIAHSLLYAWLSDRLDSASFS